METPTEYTPRPNTDAQPTPAPSAEGVRVWVARDYDRERWIFLEQPAVLTDARGEYWSTDNGETEFPYDEENKLHRALFGKLDLAPGQCVEMVLVGAEDYRSKTLAIENFRRTLRDSLLATAEQRERADAATARAEAGEKALRDLVKYSKWNADQGGEGWTQLMRAIADAELHLWQSANEAALTPHPTAAGEAKNGVALIAAERQRQKDKEGWTPEHDDEHTDNSLVAAAICYAYTHLHFPNSTAEQLFEPHCWPNSWSRKWWKPDTDTVRNLTKAGALIAAEIDRLKRADSPPSAPQPAAPFKVGEEVEFDCIPLDGVTCPFVVRGIITDLLEDGIATVKDSRGALKITVPIVELRRPAPADDTGVEKS